MTHNKKYRRQNVLGQGDAAAMKKLLQAREDDYPAQEFYAIDSAHRPCVILHFDNARGDRDFQTFYFSSHETALAAFHMLSAIDEGEDEVTTVG